MGNPPDPSSRIVPKKASSLWGRPWGEVLVAVAVAAAVALGVYWTVRLSQLESRLNEADRRLDQVVAQVTEISEQTRQAAERATEAERNSRLSAEGRRQAEAERNEARRIAEEAREEAASARNEAEVANREKQEVLRQREEELKRLQENLSRIAETRRTALGLVMNLGSDALGFDFDKADLRPQNRELLSRILGVLLTLDKGFGVYVYGHTDDVGSEAYNLELSRKRAEAVRDYLVKGGLNPAIVTTKGFGQSIPLVSGTTPEARAKNRRVEIGIVQTNLRFEKALPDQ